MGVMKKKMNVGICLGALCICLAGCGGEAAAPADGTGEMDPLLEENIITYQLLEEPELEYDVPELTPGLCVPMGGYDVAEEKIAHVYGKILPTEFYLLKKESGEVVYTGTLSEVQYHKDTDTYSAVADFTEVSVEGEYVLQCDYLGYSYSFTIQESLQEDMLAEMILAYPELLAKSEDLQENVDGMLILLLSYELYGEVYGEDTDVLDALNKYVEVLQKEIQEEESVLEYDPYMVAALLAKFGHFYQEVDWNAGNDAIKLAKKLWKNGEKDETLTSEYRTLAAAELYRVTGTYSFRQLVQEHLNAQIEAEELLGNPHDVLAALTHFNTDYKVQRTLCTTLMDEILNKAETVASYISLDNQLLGSSGREEKMDETMWNMVWISAVEYVITNYEYGDLLENQYFYLQGRNLEAYDYVNGMIVENPRWQASYMMMLCEHLAHDHLK